MTSFATPSDLQLLLRLSSIDTDAATLLLELASNAVRADVGQTIDAAADETVTVDGTPGRALLLDELPVTGVSAVSINGVALVEKVDFDWHRSGILHRCGTAITTPDYTVAAWSWGGRPRSVEVTYSHGWETTSRQWQAARGVALQVAARCWTNPQQLGSETIGDWARSWNSGGTASASGLELSLEEKRQLDALRP